MTFQCEQQQRHVLLLIFFSGLLTPHHQEGSLEKVGGCSKASGGVESP